MSNIFLRSTVVLLSSFSFGYSTSSVAQNVSQFETAEMGSAVTHASRFEAFRPKARTDRRRLDYQIWDDVLQNIVVDFGISSRIRSSRPQQSTGTRIVSGHTSPYRLEGSRIAFGFLNDGYREALTQYREDLVNVANQIDISRLSKDEQLAFWFNLHNVALIEKISQYYPEDVPSTLMIDIGDSKALIDEAKFLEIRGQALSLRDIRENIVYKYWSDPIVIYGFFRGDIGGPRMLRLAFTANNLEYRLNGNANEFVNSLRGFHESRKARKVSKIYDEARPYFFPNWEADISAHIKRFAEGDTLEDFNSGKPFELDKYETKIADLSGGQRRASGLFIEGSGNLPPETLRLLTEVAQKEEILRKRGVYTGLSKGYVIIEDIETDPNQDIGATIE
jgi:hypothetical protein